MRIELIPPKRGVATQNHPGIIFPLVAGFVFEGDPARVFAETAEVRKSVQSVTAEDAIEAVNYGKAKRHATPQLHFGVGAIRELIETLVADDPVVAVI